MMKEKEKFFIYCLLKSLWLFAILFGFLALRLELGVFRGFIPRIDVDATYMLDSLIATNFILSVASFIVIKYL